ncbi:MAG: hypothetical protein EBR40_04670, partial [Proteobacteria bacterium]|nr:hypothetical protein [Pseudomonadota bacterium]
DLILLYTDGITEALDANGTEYGVERLRQELHLKASSGSAETLRHLADSVRTFAGDQPQHDDITLIALRKKPVS